LEVEVVVLEMETTMAVYHLQVVEAVGVELDDFHRRQQGELQDKETVVERQL
jgi:hypothetical protein